jgi:hypothetical protein
MISSFLKKVIESEESFPFSIDPLSSFENDLILHNSGFQHVVREKNQGARQILTVYCLKGTRTKKVGNHCSVTFNFCARNVKPHYQKKGKEKLSNRNPKKFFNIVIDCKSRY